MIDPNAINQIRHISPRLRLSTQVSIGVQIWLWLTFEAVWEMLGTADKRWTRRHFRFWTRFGHELAAPCRPHNLSGFVDCGMSQTSASPISQRTTRSSQRRRWAALRFEACGGGSPGIVALRTIWTARHDLAAVLHTSNRFGRKADV